MDPMKLHCLPEHWHSASNEAVRYSSFSARSLGSFSQRGTSRRRKSTAQTSIEMERAETYSRSRNILNRHAGHVLLCASGHVFICVIDFA